jgi:hypothetical protein
MNRLRICGSYTQWNSIQPQRMKILFPGKWMELENIILSELAKFRKLKATYFLSYAEHRPNTNASNIMKNRSH